MSALGDVLERLYARPDGSVSLHATVREWRDIDKAEQVADTMKSRLPGMDASLPWCGSRCSQLASQRG